MLSVAGLAKSFGQQTLFTGVSLQLTAGNRYGLVGANGSGKSTLLRILAGEEPPSDGTVAIPKRARVGVLRQDHFRYETTSILDVVMMGNQPLWHAMTQKEALLASAEQHFEADRYADLEEVILQHDGYSLEARAGEILEGLGVVTEVHRQELSTLSGGFKLRVLLAQTLAAQPDALLLDEPTNHLDILSIRWLEKFLLDYPGCAVVVSHDHRFLDNVCNHIVDVDYETALLYKGNYSQFVVAKQAERERKEREIEKREKEIAHHQAFVDSFRAKATKARQAQSKIKLIERISIERLPQSSRRYPTFRLRQRRPSGRDVVRAEGIAKAFGARPVLDGVDLAVRRGDRLAIIGPNGIGKSTLLKILTGKLAPDRGDVVWGYETYPGWFAQDHHEILGESEQTVESWLWESCPGEPIGFVRGQLGAVLFSGDDVHKKVSNLSGGEGARLVFARLAVEQPNVLVLDEPTNHLDLESIEALVEGLRAYDGTLVFVSHDRWFVAQLATRILEIAPAGLRDFAGTYDEYLERLGDDHLDAEAVLLRARREKRREKELQARRAGQSDAERQKLQRRLAAQRDRLTAEIEKAEGRIHAINELFCDPAFFGRTPRPQVQRLEAEQKQLSARVEELMAEWEKAESELAALEA
jgi:ATPase subunit of ABC transporter with duplicated ATPase domains